MKRSLAAAFILPALAAVANAQPVTSPEVPETAVAPADATRIELAVDLRAPDGAIDADAVYAAIGGELGIRVAGPGSFAPALGRLTIAIDGTNVNVRYEPSAGSAIERALPLPALPNERVETIAFVATNLVRDQASELLARLQQPAPPALAPVVAVPPKVAPPVLAAKVEPREVAATIGFIPPLSLDRIAGQHVVIGAGLSVLVGATDGSRYLSIAGLYDSEADFASGVQIAGLGAVTGHVDMAAQIAGLGALSRGTAEGVQIGGLVAAAHGSATGFQIGGLAAATGGDLEGIQIGGLVSAARGTATGIQIAGLATAADHVRGIQIGGLANAANRIDGLQIAGLANVGGEVNGAQIGVVNIARKMNGLQIGVVNVMEDGDDAYPIGLINYAKNGDVAIDAWEESSRLTGLALRHGPRHIHNVWSLAWSPDHDHVLAGAGLGTTLRTNLLRSTIDIDAMSYFADVTKAKLEQLNQLRATLAVPLGPIDIIGGAAMNVYVSHNTMDESADFHPYMARQYGTELTTRVVMWPTVFAGVRLHAK